MRPVVYSLQFRGQAAARADGVVRKEASAPGCALVTSLTPAGVDGRFVWAAGDEEAFLASTLAFTDEHGFEETGTIAFSRGNTVRIDGRGQLATSPDPHLRQGSVVWKVAGGQGQFEGATGLITSNFLLSDSGELTENQLGVIFANGR